MSSRRPPRTPFVQAVTFATLLASVSLSGCGSDPAPTGTGGGGGGFGSGSTTFSGTISGSGVSGALQIVIATSTPSPQAAPARARGNVSATGEIEQDGGSGRVNLTGVYDDVQHVLSLSGGGWTVAGGLVEGRMEGVFGGPGGISGVFSLLEDGTGADEVIVVVGYFTSTTGGPGGSFNFSIVRTVVHGNAWATGDSAPIPLNGTFNPANGAIVIDNPQNPGTPLATGTLGSTAASGTYDDGAGDQGTWSGTLP